MNKLYSKYLVVFLRLGFGVILIASSINKLADPFTFSIAVKNYDVIGPDLSRWAAVFIPFLEAFTGLMLVFGIWLKASATVNLLLMCAFLVLVGQAYIRGLDISCGCFHMEEGKISALKLGENLLFVFAGLLLYKKTAKL